MKKDTDFVTKTLLASIAVALWGLLGFVVFSGARVSADNEPNPNYQTINPAAPLPVAISVGSDGTAWVASKERDGNYALRAYKMWTPGTDPKNLIPTGTKLLGPITTNPYIHR